MRLASRSNLHSKDNGCPLAGHRRIFFVASRARKVDALCVGVADVAVSAAFERSTRSLLYGSILSLNSRELAKNAEHNLSLHFF
uniref:Uncharacterized protein n=1 Tax=Parascaris univalens TaxID=6257 RepID=A0A915BE93_PARUN